MTTYILVLCILQGVCEFLPVSSTAHMDILGHFFKDTPTTIEWEVALHLGTLLSTIIYFWRDLWEMVKSFLAWVVSPINAGSRNNPYLKQAFCLVIATLPAVCIGYVAKKIGIKNSPHLIGTMAIIFGCLLYLVDRFQTKQNEKVSYGKALGIGMAQVLAFIPGASRSGTCITAARAFGLSRVEATRFSFLLSIPTVMGAVSLTAYDAIQKGIVLESSSLAQAITLTAIIGLVVIHGLLKFLENHTFFSFMVYRVLLGLVLLFAF